MAKLELDDLDSQSFFGASVNFLKKKLGQNSFYFYSTYLPFSTANNTLSSLKDKKLGCKSGGSLIKVFEPEIKCNLIHTWQVGRLARSHRSETFHCIIEMHVVTDSRCHFAIKLF